MLKRLSAAVVVAATMATGALAEVPTAPATTMETPRMGDHWTYVHRDEITGQIMPAVTYIVTDVTGSEISMRVTIPGRPDNYLIYDRAWNVLNDGTWRFTPSNGYGIKEPLAVGKTWTISGIGTTAAGASWPHSAVGKVVGQESITTKAGTFDTFEIETTFDSQDKNDATRKAQGIQRLWYAPAINHWVKVTNEARVNGTLRTKTSMELIDYGRRN